MERPLLPADGQGRRPSRSALAGAAFAACSLLIAGRSLLVRSGPSIAELPGQSRPEARVVTTARAGGRLAESLVPMVAAGAAEDNVARLNLTGSALGQEISGFGGAFTEASAVTFMRLAPKLQEEFLERYFGSDGIGFTVGRVHINSCDFSVSSYSFDDVPDDWELAHFDTNVTRDTLALIPLIKKAQRRLASHGQSLRLFASPWSPPAWMKTNGQMDESLAPGLRLECQAVWAAYIVKWLDAYTAHDVPLWAITVQNEPDWNASGYEACLFTAEQEAGFLGAHLGPAMRQAHPQTKIFVYDHNKDHLHEWARTMAADPVASRFVDGIAMHWYRGDHFDKVSATRRDFPEMPLLASEATFEARRWGANFSVEHGQWDFGEGYAHDILGDLNGGAVGWTDWNLLLDTSGGPNHAGNTCDAAMMASDDGQALYVHPQFYYMAHFSKYITRGSRRLVASVQGTSTYDGPPRDYGVCTAEDGIQATAFVRPDGVVAVVALNCADEARSFEVEDRGNALRVAVPARAVQTYLFERDSQ